MHTNRDSVQVEGAFDEALCIEPDDLIVSTFEWTETGSRRTSVNLQSPDGSLRPLGQPRRPGAGSPSR